MEEEKSDDFSASGGSHRASMGKWAVACGAAVFIFIALFFGFWSGDAEGKGGTFLGNLFGTVREFAGHAASVLRESLSGSALVSDTDLPKKTSATLSSANSEVNSTPSQATPKILSTITSKSVTVPSSSSAINLIAVVKTETVSSSHVFTVSNPTSSALLSCDFAVFSEPIHTVLLNEIAWAGMASDKTTHEWIELKNNTNETRSLSGWQLVNKTGKLHIRFDDGDSLAAGAFYLLVRGSGETVPFVTADKIFMNAIKNSDESLRLFDGNCVLVDEVVADMGNGKNWPAGTAGPDYRTMERSTDLTWHTYNGTGVNGIFGTPKSENSPSPPLPVIMPSFTPSPTSSAVTSAFISTSILTASSSPTSTQFFTFSVSKNGDGEGTIASNPAGIACGEGCAEDSEDYEEGTVLTLSVTPAPNSLFDGWSGACTGTGDCIVTMNETKSVIASFHSVSPLSPPPSPSPARSNVNHILISQVQITGGAGQTTNDFIEIYNPTDVPFNLKGYRLVKRTQTGTSDTLIKSWTSDFFIPAYGFYLWASSDYSSISVAPDVTTSQNIADNNGVAIRFGPNDTGTIIDSVSWGNAANVFIEGNVFPINPGPNQSFIRKTWNGDCVGSSLDRVAGNGCDTNNNANDFEILENSSPRNSQNQ